MKERPILFSAPMVRAILAGTKTQTRRIIKPSWSRCLDLDEDDDRERALIGCPYGKNGDTLWVRETWYCDNTAAPNWNPGKRIEPTPELIDEWRESMYYRADAVATGTCCELIPECMCSEYKRADGRNRSPWRPGIHMPRWASRITLEVANVRVERVKDVTEQDARAEGVRPFLEVYQGISAEQRIAGDRVDVCPYRTSFACLWDEINGDRGFLFSANPWVWVIEFKRVEAARSAA